METLQKRQRILSILQEAQDELAKNPSEISNRVYSLLDTICKLGYAWNHRNSEKGWLKPLGLFSSAEGDLIESRFQDFEQTGGGPKQDAEFDKEYSTFQDLLQKIYTQWHEIQSSLGIVAAEQLESILPPSDSAEFKASPQSILKRIQTEPAAQKEFSPILLSFISSLLEMIRIWVAYSSIDSTTYRILLSFSQMILDTLRGQVRQALFSFVGLFGQNGFYLSILLRLIINTVEVISPDLRNRLEFDMYRNVKTMIAAVILWIYSTVAPQSLKYKINLLLKEVKQIAKDESINLDELSGLVQKTAKDQNLDFPEFPLENLPSYDDLLVLGDLLKNPEIACRPSFQKLIAPLRSIFPLRFTLDLFGIPTGQIEIQDLCKQESESKATRKQQPKSNSKQRRGAKTRKQTM